MLKNSRHKSLYYISDYNLIKTHSIIQVTIYRSCQYYQSKVIHNTEVNYSLKTAGRRKLGHFNAMTHES